MLRFAVLGVVATILTGCGPVFYSSGGHHRHHGSSSVGVLVAGAAIGAAVVVASRPRRVYVHETTTYYVSTPPAFVLTPPPPDGPVRFDVQGARARLNRIDLSACSTERAAQSYGHAKVTFLPDGHVAKVVVDRPSNLRSEEVRCIGELLGRTTVAPYDGGPVAVGASFYLP